MDPIWQEKNLTALKIRLGQKSAVSRLSELAFIFARSALFHSFVLPTASFLSRFFFLFFIKFNAGRNNENVLEMENFSKKKNFYRYLNSTIPNRYNIINLLQSLDSNIIIIIYWKICIAPWKFYCQKLNNFYTFHITIFIRKGSMIKKFDNFPNFLSPKLKNQFPVRKIRLFALRKNKSRLRNLIR